MDKIEFNCDINNSDKIAFYVEGGLLAVETIETIYEGRDIKTVIGLARKDAIKLANYILENVNDE